MYCPNRPVGNLWELSRLLLFEGMLGLSEADCWQRVGGNYGFRVD